MVKNIGGQEDSLSWLFFIFIFIRDCRGDSTYNEGVSKEKKKWEQSWSDGVYGGCFLLGFVAV